MRARGIKPEFFKNEELGELPPDARLLFIGLWLLADREGLLEYRPKKINAEIFPYDSRNSEKLLGQLGEKKLIDIWCEKTDFPPPDDKRPVLIHIPKFKIHQNPHKKEKSSKLIDLYNSRVITGLFVKFHEKAQHCPADSGLLTPGSGLLIPDSCKNTYGTFSNVFLTNEEFEKLKEKFKTKCEEKIDTLSEYMSSKGAKYKNHYATILTWDRKDHKRQPSRETNLPAGIK